MGGKVKFVGCVSAFCICMHHHDDDMTVLLYYASVLSIGLSWMCQSVSLMQNVGILGLFIMTSHFNNFSGYTKRMRRRKVGG